MTKQSYVSDLYSVSQRIVSRELKERTKPEENQEINFENRLWRVVRELQPTEITIGRDPEISWKDFPYQPDLFAVFESFVIVAEARYTSSNSYLLQGLSKLEEAKSVLSSLVRQEFDNKKLFLLFAIKDKQDLNDTLQRRAHNAGIRIVDERDIDYFLKLSKDAGIGIYYQFFAKVAPSLMAVNNEEVLAIKVKEGKRTKYIFSINPHELLERSFVSHRELNSPDESILGYQRMIKKSKLKEIAKYIEDYGGFPSPIIVSVRNEVFDPISHKVSKKHEDIEFGTLRLSAKPATVYIVDGQHRLYGYTRVERNSKHFINVIAYKGLRGSDEGTMFVDINLKQTKVPSQLLWELYPDILSPDEETYHKAVISRAVEKIATTGASRGKVAHISSGNKGTISFPTLCSEIERVGFVTKGGAGIIGGLAGNDWDAQAKKLSDILDAFFDAIESFREDYYDVNKRFFVQNTGIVPLIRILGKICKQIQSEQPGLLRSSKQRISDAIKPYLRILYDYYGKRKPDELDKLRKARVGGSGFNTTEDEMDDQIRKTYPSFPMRNKRVPQELRDAVNLFVSAVADINRKCSNNSTPWIFRDFDADHIHKKLEKPAKSTSLLQQFVILVHQELIESSGGVSQKNPLNRILNVSDIYDFPIIQKLSYLRNKYAHRNTQITPEKRAEALQFIQELAGSQSITNFDELDSEQCFTAQISLLNRMRQELLSVVLRNLG